METPLDLMFDQMMAALLSPRPLTPMERAAIAETLRTTKEYLH